MVPSHLTCKWSQKCSMGERSSALASYCNTLTLWMRKMFWVCLAVCGQALQCWKIPTLCCCKYGTTTGSIILSRQRNATIGTAHFSQASCSLFLTVLSQALVPVAFLSKRPNFRPERNLLRWDEVVRKQSSRGIVYPICLIWVGPRHSWFAEICSVVDLLLICGVGNAKQHLLPTCHTDGSLTLLKRHSRPMWNDAWHWFSRFFVQFPVFVLTIRKLSNCVLCDLQGIIHFAVHMHILHVIFLKVKVYDYIMA